MQFAREVMALLFANRLLMGLDPSELRMDLCGTDDEKSNRQAYEGGGYH